MKKRIGLATQVLQYKEASGFGYYVAGLTHALQDKKLDDLEFVDLKSRWSENLPTWKRWYYDQIELPNEAKRHQVDVLHQTCFSCPTSKTKTIWTLHDLRPLVLSEPMSKPAALYWRKWLPYTAKAANVVVCISENTRQDALKHLNLPEEKFRVIPVGLPQVVRDWRYSKSNAEKYKEKFKITGPYFSTVGTIQPIKNFPFLVDVFVALKKAHNLKDHQLVIIGKKGWDYDAVAKKLAEHNLSEGKEVIITDYVTEDEKWCLMHDSEAFLFPSLYEGFGIPPIEAQYIGVPVISSNTSSLPDVVGEGGLLCSPTQVKDWVSACETLAKNRAKLIEDGKQNVTRFYWDKIADQWVELYRSVA